MDPSPFTRFYHFIANKPKSNIETCLKLYISSSHYPIYPILAQLHNIHHKTRIIIKSQLYSILSHTNKDLISISN